MAKEYKITFLRPKIHKRLKVLAAKQGMAMGELVSNLLDIYEGKKAKELDKTLSK